jgi:DNA (cytosine-5)-methyltransferase 1
MGKLAAVSLFSGCGGFDLGVTKCGVDIIWANDIDYHAASAYRSLFPDVEFVHDNIRNIEFFPRADILIGCYPCTGFSEAAKRRWKNREERDLTANPDNHLFIEFLRAIDQVKPKFIFIENVRGMLSASSGFFINKQLDGLKNRGFSNTQYKLLNAAEFGVAQTRKRLFIVGVHDSVKNFSYEFPLSTHGNTNNEAIKTIKNTIGHLPEWPEGEFLEKKFHGHFLTRNRKRGWNEPSYTIVANASHIPLHPIGEKMARIGKDHWEIKGELNRRLSWRECALIQDLPETIEIDGGLEPKYKVIGNAVPPKLAEAIAKPVVVYLSQ